MGGSGQEFRPLRANLERWLWTAGAARRVPLVSCARVDTRPVRDDRLAALPTPHCQDTAADEGRESDNEPDSAPGHETLGCELRVEPLQDPDRSNKSDH
jgi:hypothetical protein